MIYREIIASLKIWKNEKGRMPLLLRGARQVGKSYVVDKFGEQEFSSYILLNFERNPEYKKIFTSFDPIEMLERIQLFTGKKN